MTITSPLPTTFARRSPLPRPPPPSPFPRLIPQVIPLLRRCALAGHSVYTTPSPLFSARAPTRATATHSLRACLSNLLHRVFPRAATLPQLRRPRPQAHCSTRFRIVTRVCVRSALCSCVFLPPLQTAIAVDILIDVLSDRGFAVSYQRAEKHIPRRCGGGAVADETAPAPAASGLVFDD